MFKLKSFRYGFWIGLMLSFSKKAGNLMTKEAISVKEAKRILKLLKRTIWCAERALKVGDGWISPEHKEDIEGFVLQTKKTYQRQLAHQMCEHDQELVASVLEYWVNKGFFTMNISLTDQLAGMFENAKSFLDSSKDIINTIYGQEIVPAPLKEIMQSFAAEEITQEEAKRRLDDCAAKLKELLPQLLQESPG